MQKEELYLREAMLSDIDMLFKLANDETVRKNAFHMAPISYGEHKEWFGRMIEDDSQLQFILMSGSLRVGQIRLTLNGDSAEIDYSIVSEKRGMGYGKKMVQLIKGLLHTRYPSIQKLTAKVKPSNAASIYCFEENGFQETYEQYEFNMAAYQEEVELIDDNYSGGGIPVLDEQQKRPSPFPMDFGEV